MAVCYLRKAEMEDLQTVRQILVDGKDLQRAQGFVQWDDDYPLDEDIRQDLEHQKGYLFMVNDSPAGYVLLEEEEPAYFQESALWDTSLSFLAIHRMALAKAYQNKGLSASFFSLCEDFGREAGKDVLRIDTHRDNRRMQHLLKKYGFVSCGRVAYPIGSRICFEKKLTEPLLQGDQTEKPEAEAI